MAKRLFGPRRLSAPALALALSGTAILSWPLRAAPDCDSAPQPGHATAGDGAQENALRANADLLEGTWSTYRVERVRGGTITWQRVGVVFIRKQERGLSAEFVIKGGDDPLGARNRVAYAGSEVTLARALDRPYAGGAGMQTWTGTLSKDPVSGNLTIQGQASGPRAAGSRDQGDSGPFKLVKQVPC